MVDCDNIDAKSQEGKQAIVLEYRQRTESLMIQLPPMVELTIDERKKK